MSRSRSIGNRIHSFNLAVAGAKSYSKELPKEAQPASASLEKRAATITALNADQEKQKQALAMTTRRLTVEIAEGQRESARIVRLAEAVFGPRDPKMKEFRPATEGRIVRRQKKAA